MAEIDLSIIIVSWNVADLVVDCLDSLFASPIAVNEPQAGKALVEIIVVDSASQDHTAAIVSTGYPQVKVLAQKENVGFARGNNIGLEIAQGRHIFLLNPDTVVLGDAIPKMIDYLDQNPDVGMIGPHTLNDDRTTQSTRRQFPNKAIAFFESTWLQSFAPQSLLKRYYMTDNRDNTTMDVDWVQGSALMARREVYEQIGGIDTDFVMYFEELDWCKRAKDAGWRVVYLGDVQIIHYGGKSSEQANTFKHIHFQTSKVHYFEKYHGWLFATVLRWFLLISYAWQILLESLKSLIGHKRALRQQRIQTYLAVLRSGLKVK